MKELVVDTTRFEKMGMTILTAEDVKGMRSSQCGWEWPEEYSGFAPSAVTLEEALKTMEKCK